MLERKLEDVIDQYHSISLLTQCKERRHKAVATYGDTYTEVAGESQIIDHDILVHIMKLKRETRKLGKRYLEANVKL